MKFKQLNSTQRKLTESDFSTYKIPEPPKDYEDEAECEFCHEIFPADEMNSTDYNENICDTCIDREGFHVCSGCSTVITEDDYLKIGRKVYCVDCQSRVGRSK